MTSVVSPGILKIVLTMLNHAHNWFNIGDVIKQLTPWVYKFTFNKKKIFYILYDLQWDQLNKDFQWTSYFENTNINF